MPRRQLQIFDVAAGTTVLFEDGPKLLKAYLLQTLGQPIKYIFNKS